MIGFVRVVQNLTIGVYVGDQINIDLYSAEDWLEHSHETLSTKLLFFFNNTDTHTLFCCNISFSLVKLIYET